MEELATTSEELATTSQQHEDVSRSEGAAPGSRRASSLPPRSRLRAQTVAGLSSEISAHQRARGARPLRVCSSVAAMMLTLTFTCRALLLFLLSESVQTDKTAVRPELSFLKQRCRRKHVWKNKVSLYQSAFTGHANVPDWTQSG